MSDQKSFTDDLSSAINRHSRENGSNTPDFILADFLASVLTAFDVTSRAREKWYGRELSIGGGDPCSPPPAPTAGVEDESAMPETLPEAILRLVDDRAALEIGRRAVEEELIRWRDSRLSEPTRGNGLVVREKDGRPSSIIRFGTETALRIALRAIADGRPSRPVATDPPSIERVEGMASEVATLAGTLATDPEDERIVDELVARRTGAARKMVTAPTAGVADESAMPEPLPEVLPAGTRSTYGAVALTELCLREPQKASHELGYWGRWSTAPGDQLYNTPDHIDWKHWRTLQSQTDPPSIERVEGMASEVKGLDGAEVPHPARSSSSSEDNPGARGSDGDDEAIAAALRLGAAEAEVVRAARRAGGNVGQAVRELEAVRNEAGARRTHKVVSAQFYGNDGVAWNELDPDERTIAIHAYRFARAEGYEARKAEESSSLDAMAREALDAINAAGFLYDVYGDATGAKERRAEELRQRYLAACAGKEMTAEEPGGEGPRRYDVYVKDRTYPSSVTAYSWQDAYDQAKQENGGKLVRVVASEPGGAMKGQQ
jgi:hypothetical protein